MNEFERLSQPTDPPEIESENHTPPASAIFHPHPPTADPARPAFPASTTRRIGVSI
jgi:hypothetical protein